MTPGDSSHRTCPQGHAVPDQLDQCPVCGKPPAEEAAEEVAEETRGRSLWELMGHTEETTPTDRVDPDQQQTALETTGDEDDEDDEQNGTETEEDHDTAEAQRPRGLWDLMQQGDEDEDDDAVPELPETDPVELADATGVYDDEEEEEEEEEDDEEEDDEEEDDEEEDDEDESDPGTAATARELSKSCRISLVTSIIAILLAGLGLVPPVIWTSLPALIAGLVAVYTGVVGFSETGSSSGRLRGRGRAMVGIGLGTLGMFLPLMLRTLL